MDTSAQTYKLNIHSHTIFSDGINSPYKMALKSKEVNFSATVLTDHFYGHKLNEYRQSVSLNKDKYSVLMQSKVEIEKNIMPCIIGIEIPFMGQEVLIFGQNAIWDIFENGLPDQERLLKMKESAAIVLCHPRAQLEIINAFLNYVDAFEHFNSGYDCFKIEGLPKTDKQRWCNSDAHREVVLANNYNILKKEIKTEADLINYIKSGEQPEFYRRRHEIK